VRIENREVKSYAEPVSATELQEESTYFSVQFVDDDMVVPIMLPLVFIGRNLNSGDVRRIYFQDAESFRRGIRYPSVPADSQAQFYEQDENELKHIFEFEHAIDVLIRCSIRRREGPGAENR
jgi:hypothetical protein